jgi:CrcB protein
MQKILLLAFAGALGTLARYGLALFVHRFNATGFPWETFAVNMLGCFVFGIIWALAEEKFLITSDVRFLCLTGFIAAFTTFSTFMFDSLLLMRHSQWMLAILNIVGQNLLGVSFLCAGFLLAKML